jgi:retron-type reverse transcriptase
MEEWDYADGWVLKGDVHHFFASIDHEKLKERLATRFDDERFQRLQRKYIDAADGLELNDKTNILPLKNGIDFCGFHTYLTQSGKVVRKLRRSSVKRIKRRMKSWEAEYRAGEVTQEKIMERFQSWEAHAKHGDTRQLREEMKKRVLKIFETEKE